MRLSRLTPILILALLMTACGGGGSNSAIPTIDLTANSFVGLTATALAVEDGPQPTTNPSTVVADDGAVLPTVNSGDFPFALTAEEQIAATSGDAVYSGYACVIAFGAGCACETPVIERASFTPLPGERISYVFSGEGYGSTWELGRLAPNQYSYTLPLFDDTGQFRGSYLILITFLRDGYLYNLGADIDGELVTCPDITFRRLPG